jgi:hypothetical protein
LTGRRETVADRILSRRRNAWVTGVSAPRRRSAFRCKVQRGKRRAAAAAGPAGREVHRRSGVRAVDGAKPLGQLGDLLRAERLHEVLLTQEIEERGQATVAVRAPQVGEGRIAPAVGGQPQPPLAAGTLRDVRVRERRWTGSLRANHGKERQGRPRGQPRALMGVEPEGLTGMTDVDGDRWPGVRRASTPPWRPGSGGTASGDCARMPRPMVVKCRRCR